MEDNKNDTKQLHRIAIVPTPGMGHLYPLIEFAKRLVVQHEFAVTFVIPTDGSSMELQKKLMESLPDPISHTFLPPVSLDDILEDDDMIETRIELSLARSLPALRYSLEAMIADDGPLSAVVVDLFGPAAFDVARELGIPPFIFFPTTAMVLSFFFHLPELDASTSMEFRLLPDPIALPGCPPVHGRDLFSPLHERGSEAYKSFVKMTRRYGLAQGIMINTFAALEPGPIKALQDRIGEIPPIYPIGPLTRPGFEAEIKPNRPDCLIWLDDQPASSVVFVSFGSGGTLSSEQLTELALGLEKSGQRFLWVLKSPNENSSHGAFFTLRSQNEPLDHLPKGFSERTKSSGLVLTSWAPQAQILAHGSVGGFLTHCGWNSTLESVTNGVPMIAWPLYAEQKMNAVFLSGECVGAAKRVEGARESGIVGRDEVAKKVRELMEGEEGKAMRKRAGELKVAAEAALESRGSSTKSLGEVARIWRGYTTIEK